VSAVRDADSQQSRLLFLGSKENKIDEAFGHVRGQSLLPRNVLLNHVIDFAVQAALR
jgi:hypothetical protein